MTVKVASLLILLGMSVTWSWAFPAHSTPVPTPAHLLLHAFFPTHRLVRDMTCLECKAVAGTLDAMMAAGATVEELEDFTIVECINFELFPPDVCSGMVRLCGSEVLHVINNTAYNYDTICGWLLGGHCQSTELQSWSLSLPDDKPEPSHPEPQQPTPATVKILHLSDLHVDLQYDEGSAVTCAHPLCCRYAFGSPGEGEEGAGKWGSLGECDIPLITLEDLIAQAALTNPDLVYVTGDLPPHDVWAQDHVTNLAAINVTLEILKRHFPDTPVINALGNHASAPVNSFVVPAAYDSGFDMAWLYESVAEMWSHWLPYTTQEDIRLGGFFSYSPIPGLRVISLNMNYCNTLNWWLLLENADPVGELQWLINTLAAAEASGELVHILGHIPPGGGDCDHIWSHVYTQIITRFESTIRGMFFGHKHKDSFQVLYDPDSNYTRPVAAVFIPGAGTTGDVHMPAFRLYQVDGGHDAATWTILDTETYNMNLTLANQDGATPEFTLRYRGQETYNITSFTPVQLDHLAFTMATDDVLFREYLRHYNNYQDQPPEMWDCDADCRKNYLCKMVTGDSSSSLQCDRISDLVDAASP
ncbi:hypothetical protein Pcinc_024280 [Petrolisthes cinctipes]|uniref:Sphingomyelin phosphodiesterase n=1 Tax=Petrolisthes cinctipes TaxID=88211 RepID=A0AAE1KDT5_PETCI|nr:hypothetical protein Pcinc_024280 [Petrolisthes cinctipes]